MAPILGHRLHCRKENAAASIKSFKFESFSKAFTKLSDNKAKPENMCLNLRKSCGKSYAIGMFTSPCGGTYAVYDQVEAIRAETKRVFKAKQLGLSVDILAPQYYQMSLRRVSNESFRLKDIILIPELKL